MQHISIRARKRLVLLALASSSMSFFVPSIANAQDMLPNGSNIASGAANIVITPNTVTINQSTPKAVINWNTFSIAQGNSVVFHQPNKNSATLNRVTSNTPSLIAGEITSNGAVYLINPNGIAITANGNIQTAGGFIGSTLGLSDDDFNAGKLDFKGQGSSASINNSGGIYASDNSYVALLGGSISNSGVINAPLGRVGLGSAEKITLDLTGDGFMQVALPTSALTAAGDSLINMAGSITAAGGRVELRAATVKDAVRNVINMPGSINADSALGNGGSIILFGGASEGDWGGTVTVNGNLSARAAGASGNGGFVETSGAHVDLNGISVNTTAANGNTGTWLIDPKDFIVASSDGDITGAALSANLGSSNVTILSSSGAGGTIGNINVYDPIAWSTSSTLTLNAVSNINLGASINAPLGGLTLIAGTPNSNIFSTAPVNVNKFVLSRGTWTQNAAALPGFAANDFNISTTASTFIRVTGGDGTTATPYLISDAYGLQGMASGNLLANSFALANNINAGGTVNWNAGLGFIPIGTDGATGTFSAGNGFTGSFNGNGFSITGLTINRPAFSFVGVFGASNGSISNVNLVGGSFTGGLGGSVSSITGSILASMRGGSLTDVTSSAIVNGANGANAAFGAGIPSSEAGSSFTGGLVGFESVGSITKSSTTGAVTAGNGGNAAFGTSGTGGSSYVGGLVGFWSTGSVTQSFATGNIIGGSGGSARLSSFAGSSRVGGLVGQLDAGSVLSSYSISNVTGGTGGNAASTGTSGRSATGGLVGFQGSASIDKSYYVGNVVGGNAGISTSTSASASFTGGLVGTAFGTITSSYSAGTVRGGNGGAGSLITAGGDSVTGGLFGQTVGNIISDSFSNANVIGGNAGKSSTFGPYGNSSSGGFAGVSSATIKNSYATGSVAGGVSAGDLLQFSNAGGFSGYNLGSITQSYASGAVTGGTAGVGSFDGASAVTGGFTGYNSGSITQSYATGRVNGGASGQLLFGSTVIGSITGGFAGYNFAAGSISQAYASGQVTEGSTGAIFTGGFIGNQEAGGTISNTYWDSFSTTRATGFGTNNGTITNQLSVTSDPAQSAAANYAYNTSSYANFTPGAGLGTAAPTGWVYFDGQTRPFLAFEVPASGSSIANAHQLQLIGLGTSLAGTYTLSKNIDLSETGTNLGTTATSAGMWRSGGWVPLGTNGISNFWNGTAFAGGGTPSGFSGSVNGNGYTVSGLSINRPASTYVGLLGFATGSISNLNLINSNVTGRTSVGGLAGLLFTGASISGVNTSGSVTGAFGIVTGPGVGNVGGLAGVLQGASISNSSSTGNVKGAAFIGGLVGYQLGTASNSTISNSSSSAIVTAEITPQAYNNNFVGGLVGYQRSGTTNTNVSASGAVSGGSNVGGLVGIADGRPSSTTTSSSSQLIDSFATGNVSGISGVGGFAGSLAYNASLSRGYATGSVTSSNQFAGGLVGLVNGASINQSYATGSVVGVTNIGGLVGIQASPAGGSSSISNAYATGSVIGVTNVGGLIGRAQGVFNSILNSYSVGSVNNNVAGASIGGLLGSQASTTFSISGSYWNQSINSALSSAGGTGLSTAQMQDGLNYLATYPGWDFTAIWEVPNAAGQGGNAASHFPRLKFNLEP